MPVILSAVLPVFVRTIPKVLLLLNLTRPKSRLAGTSFTVPTVRVIVALAVLVISAAEVAMRVTVAFAGKGGKVGGDV